MTNNLKELQKAKLELEEIKSSRQYKICKKIFAPYNIAKNYLNQIFDIKTRSARKKHQNTNFLSDKKFVDQKLNYKKAVLLGNAKNLDVLTGQKFQIFKDDSMALTIGLNRSFYKYKTDVLMWADYEILDEIIKSDTKNLENSIVIQTTSNDTKKNLQFWIENKTFENYPYKGLFKARNILVSVLHLCYLNNIKEIELYGFEFDSRSYFFDTDKYDGISSYEIKTDQTIDDEYMGYDTQKIVQEVIEFMIEKGYRMSFSGESMFLSGLKGLVKNES